MKMKEDESEVAFVAWAKKILDQSSENLDPRTLARLKVARSRAFQARLEPAPWLLPASGFAAAFVSLLALALWWQSPSEDTAPPSPQDIELIATAEPLDFYEDLEFYHWLDESDRPT